MRTIPEVVENIKNILNGAERTQDGECLVEIDDLVNEILVINSQMECFESAFNGAIQYIVDDTGCCPCCYDNTKEMPECAPCTNEIRDRRDKHWDKEKSLECWKNLFLLRNNDLTEV